MDFRCPKCNNYGFAWDGRGKILYCPWIHKCGFTCTVSLPAGLNSWYSNSPTEAEIYNACVAAKAALTGDMYMTPDPGISNAWAPYIYAVNVVRKSNNFPMLTSEQCDKLGEILMNTVLTGADNYDQLKENLGAAAAEFGKSDWPEEDRERGYVLKDNNE